MMRTDCSSLEILKSNALTFEGVFGAEMEFIDDKCMNNKFGAPRLSRHRKARFTSKTQD